MKNGEIIREALVENTIRLIGNFGFEKATTKAIVSDGIDIPGIKMNEVYIYRIFGSKELLYAEAFNVLDNELFDCIQKSAILYAESDLPFRERMQELFYGIWYFLLQNEARCRCYVRYYYSAYFRERSMRAHRKLLQEYEKLLRPIFKDESDVISIVHAAFMSMLDFSISVYNGDIENNEENAYHIFNMIYNSLVYYFDDAVFDMKRDKLVL